MSEIPHRKALVIGLAGAIALAAVAWAIGGQIRSPAQIAADTQAPDPSLITVPVERRTLATEVVVRGSVRYGAPQSVALATSALKASSDIVTRAPRRGEQLREGSVALSMSGRPVFVLRGAQPMHRDLVPGASGPDVEQLERALERAGIPPGPIDGRYDAATAQAVGTWYRARGWTPFGATDAQVEQLRAAEAAVAAARDASLQARMTLETARRGATPGEVNQARLDAVSAEDALAAATLEVATAGTRARAAGDAADRARPAVALAAANGAREVNVARADLANKEAALTAARATQAEAQRRVDVLGPDTRPAELEALKVALRQATEQAAIARQAVDAGISNLAASQAALDEANAGGTPAAIARAEADLAQAANELATRQAALGAAIDAQTEAQRLVDQPPPDTRVADVQAARSALSQADGNVPAAQAEVRAARTTLAATRAGAKGAVAQARADWRAARRDAGLARAEVTKAQRARANAARLVSLAHARVAILSAPEDTALQAELVSAAQAELARADAEVARLAARSDIQVPADELIFFPTLPLRVDSVRARRGDTASGRVMTVSSSRLVADSSLSVNDAKLVRVGARVSIEEQDLRITVRGRVSRIADRPGTNGADPTRVHFEVTPAEAPARLVGASVRLAIQVESTRGAVLAVPLSALTVGADGSSRVQVVRGADTDYVTVTPGLVANGLVEVRPIVAAELEAGDLVVVGARGSVSPSAPPPVTSPGAATTPGAATSPGTAPTGGVTAPGAVTSPSGAP